MKRVHVVVSGFVQGVGYRHETRRKAQELGLTGWVRNTMDSKVEAVFEGEKKNIEEMVAWCHKGPLLSEVRSVDVEWGEASGEFEDFQIIT